MAQSSDMSLGGASFGAGYTPIRFAPLMSLTGPVMAPATPAAPEAAAPLIRPPVMADQSGSYEALPTYQGPPIGERLATPEGRAAELRDLGRALSFMTSPLTSTASLLATGKMPLDYVLGSMGGAAPAPGQATAAAPFGNFIQGLRDFLFGPQQESVSLAGGQMMSPGLATAAMNDAYSQALEMGMSPESAANAMSMTQSLMALGMDPYQAVSIASQHAGDVAAYNTPIAPVFEASLLAENDQGFGRASSPAYGYESSYDFSPSTGGTGVSEGFSASDVSGAQAPY